MASIRSFRATTVIRPARFVTPAVASNSVAESNSGDLPLGISQLGGAEAPVPLNTTNNAAAAGDSVQVFGLGEVCLLQIGTGGCANGDLLKPDDDGQGIKLANTAATRQAYGARALQAGAAGEMVQVQVVFGYDTRPAS